MTPMACGPAKIILSVPGCVPDPSRLRNISTRLRGVLKNTGKIGERRPAVGSIISARSLQETYAYFPNSPQNVTSVIVLFCRRFCTKSKFCLIRGCWSLEQLQTDLSTKTAFGFAVFPAKRRNSGGRRP
jgi:hypothetical protein